jgi:hypothetical protein
LNEAADGYQRLPWFVPRLSQRELWSDSPKDSAVELAHVWSLPPQPAFRTLHASGQAILESAIRRYFR